MESNRSNRKTISLSRRSFLGGVGATTASALLLGTAPLLAPTPAEAAVATGGKRKRQVRTKRTNATNRILRRSFPRQRNNGEERSYPYVANYSKALPHNSLGEVDPAAYRELLKAIRAGTFDAFEDVTLGGPKKLKNPLAGLAFDPTGYDPQQFKLPPAPRIDSARNSAEMAELYWMAVCRDLHFSAYDSAGEVSTAVADLAAQSGYAGPRRGGVLTPDTIFRGETAGDTTGPYISQFLLRDWKWGTLELTNRQRTVVPAQDYLTEFAVWLAAQDGFAPGVDELDSTPRYIRNGRDLAHYMHTDRLSQPFLIAALILLESQAPFDFGNPYVGSLKQSGFGTFDYPHLLALVAEVSTRALKAAWFQKWFVHRRLRPEEFGARIHNQLAGRATYPIHAEILGSAALDEVSAANGTWLLPLAYPEGCPPHPAYPSGHAAVAGACATILKAWFDESTAIDDPVTASADGLTLEPYTGSGAGNITVGGELDKLASNMCFGRAWAGIHWRSDAVEGLRLGEEVAIGILQDQKLFCAEKHSFTLRRFDGTSVVIRN